MGVGKLLHQGCKTHSHLQIKFLKKLANYRVNRYFLSIYYFLIKDTCLNFTANVKAVLIDDLEAIYVSKTY